MNNKPHKKRIWNTFHKQLFIFFFLEAFYLIQFDDVDKTRIKIFLAPDGKWYEAAIQATGGNGSNQLVVCLIIL